MGMGSKGDRRIGNAENTKGSGKIFLSFGRGEKVEEAERVTVAVHGVWYNIFTVNGNHKSQGGIKSYRKAESNVSDASELCVWIFMKMTGFLQETATKPVGKGNSSSETERMTRRIFCIG